tara:strand:+ start:1980 stop:3125 length:1146 start_codon:yes stop_codon:yes gene_type:complete
MLTQSMFPELATPLIRSTGILASQTLVEMATAGKISSALPITDSQIQPASLDLRLGAVAYRVQASFLPGPSSTVLNKLKTLEMHQFSLTDGAVLEKGCVYIVPLQETLNLNSSVSGTANPKSSTGRIDVFTRLLTDFTSEFETVQAGYQGPLYAEISPRTFSIVVREGSTLNQVRFRRGTPAAADATMRRLQETEGLVNKNDGPIDIKNGVAISVDLSGNTEDGLVGYKAKQHTSLIDVDKIGRCKIKDYWDPVYKSPNENGRLILNPDEFYILMSKEYVTVPLDYAAEMRAYDTKVGEFRVHYAGFFDPGFGHAESGGQGTRAVLEVRSHDVPFLIEDGQTVCRLIYEQMTQIPEKIYGASGIGSNYQGQALKLSKHFKV